MKNYSDLDYLGQMDINGLELSAYGSWTSGPFYVDGLYGFGLYNDDIRRNTLLGSTASASPGATTHTVNLNTGYNIALGKGLVTGPTLGAAYTHGRLDSYTETGGGSANMHVDAQSFDSLITDLGWQATYEMPVPVGLLTFQVRTSWRRENLSDNDAVRIELVQSPFLLVDPHGGFTRTGSFANEASPASAAADYWVLGAGVRLDLAKSAAVLLNCEEHFGSQSREQYISLSAQFSF
jgi:outer membrane autotransporter protein